MAYIDNNRSAFRRGGLIAPSPGPGLSNRAVAALSSVCLTRGPLNYHENSQPEWLQESTAGHKYLLPLDWWIALTIYPSLAKRNAAQWDESVGILDAIKRIKLDKSDHANVVEDCNWRAEMDLYSLRHF